MSSADVKSIARGTIDQGIVRRVFSYGADLDLLNSRTSAYLHLSSVAGKSISPPLSDHIRVDDLISVVVLGFDPKHNCWEVSQKAFERHQQLERLGLSRGDTKPAEVRQATEFRSVLVLEGVTAYLLAPPVERSKYKVLFDAGHLAPGKKINVTILKWTPESGLLVRFPNRQTGFESNQVYQAEVILLRPQYIKKKRKLQSSIYSVLSNGDVVRVDTSELLEVEAAFPVGSAMPVRVAETNRYTGLIDGEIAWEFTPFASPKYPAVGEVRAAVVVTTAGYGVHCLLDNRTVGFLHRSSVIGPASQDLDDYLNPGDVVEVEVVPARDPTRETFGLEFRRRLSQLTHAQSGGGAELLDLSAVRRSGTPGGFAREAGFRWNVLDAYGHRCCICGTRYALRDASAMEAAHVIPRSYRGANLLENALCLCPVHHWAFDRGLVTIDSDFVVRVAQLMRESDDGAWLSSFHGTPAHISDDSPVSRDALAWHRRNIFLDE